MTVSSTQSYVEYNADGTTTAFTIPYYFLLNSDISAMIVDNFGNISELTNSADFSVSGAGDESGGVATFNSIYPNGYQILIYRNPPATQETKYYENGKFPAKSHEAALDKLTMLIQDYGWQIDLLSLKKPNILARYYDAKGNRISNLGDPIADGDAVNKRSLDDAITDLNSNLSEQIAEEEAARKAADIAEADARAAADANLQDQLTGNVTLEASAFSVISWHKQAVDNSVTIPDNVNAWSFGPSVTISSGQQVTVGNNSFWTVADGLQAGGGAENVDYGTL